MSQTVADALRHAHLYSDGRIYRMLKLPPTAVTLAAGVVAEIAQPFCALIVDKDELTLLIPDEAQAAFSARMRAAVTSEREYRLITLDIELEPELVGFLAQIAASLSAANIPILTVAAYSRDHLLVASEDYDTAMRALRRLQVECA